jgi:flagellar motility protein MotE (MotC chaperone)
MISKLQSPPVVVALAVFTSLIVGVWAFQRTAAPLVELAAAAAAARVKAPTADLKEKGWNFWTIEIENLSTELKGERDRLRQQQDLLDRRSVQLANEAKELAKVRTEVELVQKTITDKIVEISADESKNIRSLAQTYSNLTPRAAVAILRELDDNTAVKIFSLMKPEVVSPIFEEMSRTAGADGLLSKRVAILSEKMRQLKNPAKPAPTP